jgi:transcriptional regulator with GAF, ATPase, and Fis domain
LLDVLGQVRSGALAPGSLVTIGTHVVLRLLAHPLETGSNLGLVGHSEIMADLRSRIRRMARLQDTILVRGEPGTGKELVARAVHDSSGRNARAYVPVNCAALPEALIEAELFGHVRGAFTGAPAAREGLFAAARGGTIFLDEIGDMPMAAQTRLLRVLQEGKVRPVGANTEIDVEVSVVAATNRDLRADVAAGKFRADLLTRLAGLEIEVPTLRARRSDIGCGSSGARQKQHKTLPLGLT